jgi:hypothetical protein
MTQTKNNLKKHPKIKQKKKREGKERKIAKRILLSNG